MQNNNMYTYKDKLGQSFIMTEASSKKCVISKGKEEAFGLWLSQLICVCQAKY